MPADAVSDSFLDAFADAWNRHDTDAILSMMTTDCIFEASRGPDVKGLIYSGQEAVRREIEEVFANFPDAHWSGPKHFVSEIAACRSGSSPALDRLAGWKFKAAKCSRSATGRSP